MSTQVTNISHSKHGCNYIVAAALLLDLVLLLMVLGYVPAVFTAHFPFWPLFLIGATFTPSCSTISTSMAAVDWAWSEVAMSVPALVLARDGKWIGDGCLGATAHGGEGEWWEGSMFVEIAEVLSWLKGTGDGWWEVIAAEAAGVLPQDKGTGDIGCMIQIQRMSLFVQHNRNCSNSGWGHRHRWYLSHQWVVKPKVLRQWWTSGRFDCWTKTTGHCNMEVEITISYSCSQ